jgi:hypothetical protein
MFYTWHLLIARGLVGWGGKFSFKLQGDLFVWACLWTYDICCKPGHEFRNVLSYALFVSKLIILCWRTVTVRFIAPFPR